MLSRVLRGEHGLAAPERVLEPHPAEWRRQHGPGTGGEAAQTGSNTAPVSIIEISGTAA